MGKGMKEHRKADQAKERIAYGTRKINKQRQTLEGFGDRPALRSQFPLSRA